MRRVPKKQPAQRQGEHGAILVEMAFVLPILTLILVSIINLGLIVREHQLLQNAAREGARYSSLPPNQISMSSDPAARLQAIKQFVVSYAAEENIVINAGDVNVTQTFSIPGGCGSEIVVTYTRPTLLFGKPFLPIGSLRLTARAIFHNLYGC